MKRQTMKKMGFSILAILGLGLVAGCSNSQSKAAEDDIKEITIVQMPDENNPDAGSKNKTFQKDMEKKLGIKVNELEGAEYSVGIEAMKAGKLDVLLVSPMSYFQAKKVANVEPLVTTTSMGDPYRTVFITKGDNDKIKKIEDLKGTNFAFVDPASSSGYMFPKAELVNSLKLDTDKVENPDYFFKTVAYSGKHDSSIMGVVKGDYDAAAVAESTISSLIDANMIKEGDVKIIGETEVIPNACFIIRADLPEKTKEDIKNFYLNYDDGTYFKTFYKDENIRFVEAKDSDYDAVKKIISTLKMEEN